MTDSLKLAEMQRTSIEFERQRHLANWFIKSSPHMATPSSASSSASATTAAQSTTATATTTSTNALVGNGNGTGQHNTANGTHNTTPTATTPQQSSTKHSNSGSNSINAGNAPVFFLMSSNGNTSGGSGAGNGGGGAAVNGKHNSGSAAAGATAATGNTACNAAGVAASGALGHLHIEGRKPKLRRFNSHDTSSNMFSVADFENARLARRNEIEMKQRLQRRMRMSANAAGCSAGGGGVGAGSSAYSGNGALNIGCGNAMLSSDYSTGDSKASKYSNDSQHEPLPADIFLDRYSLPRVVRISYKTKFSDETLQSSSSNGSSTVTSHSSASGTACISSSTTGIGTGTGTGTSSSTASSSGNLNSGHNNNNNNNINSNNTSSSSGAGSTKHSHSALTSHNSNATVATTAHAANVSNGFDQQDHGELFLLYRLIRQRHIYHGHNAKTAAANRKKGVLIPQEFPGYFSLINEKGLPTATLYNSLIQLVRERVYKFVSVDNMPAFTESQPNTNNSPTEGCLPIYTPSAANNRPQYVKTTARGGQVFRLLAVFEDGKQDHNAIGGGNSGVGAKPNTNHGREKEKGRYAQLLNENRQVLYVSLSTKGKFYEIEPGIPQILQKLGGMANDANKKVNADCVHRITALVTPHKELPLTLRYISGPQGCANAIPENLCITKITTENVVIACPIEDVEVQSPLHLRKLHLTKEMNLLKSSLGFESEQRMLANPNVQNILKFCQFNCDQFLKMVEVELFNRPERSGSKSRVDGLKILKPLHLPKLLRREKTSISAHEKEDSIIFLTKSDLANLEAKEAAHAANATNTNTTTTTTTTATSNTNNTTHTTIETNNLTGANRISEKMKVFQTTKKKWFRKQDKHAVNSLTSLDLDVQAKRLSMERYSDMSKLLQERFGDKPNANTQEHESISEPSGASDLGCSDTETTTLATIEEKLKRFGHATKLTEPMIQKSMSLQDIELIGGGASGKPDLLPLHARADTISEAGTDLDDLENRAPSQQQSFITEKLYNEFHVKTRQYSKSSSSLHQLLNFSLPQKLQIHETKRSLAQIKQHTGKGDAKRLDFNIGEPVTGRRAAGGLSLLAVGSSANSGNSQNTSLISPLTPTSLIEDDLPYSSVRDSLILSSDESASEHPTGNICQALNLIDYTKENIYAEICHDASAMGGIPNSQTRDTFSADTHSTQISDDYGDYASLTYPSNGACTGGAYASISNTPGNAISRVQINCSSSPISYHTVYFGDEPLGEHYLARRSAHRDSRDSRTSHDSAHSRDRSHITTVELEGATHGANNNSNNSSSTANDVEVVDNIYNTLK